VPKLSDLDARLLRYERRDVGTFLPHVDRIEDAQGVSFLCPLCFAKNGGKVGTHSVICWSRSRGVPEDAQPGPGRWKLSGTRIDDLTLNGDVTPDGKGLQSRSVQLLGEGGCKWHGYVTNGEAA